MKIAIIVPMQEEYDNVVEIFRQNADIYYAKHSMSIRHIEHKNHEIYLIICGIGKANAACHTQFMLDNVPCDHVFNVGIAGGLSDQVKIHDVVIANSVVTYDMDVSHFGYQIGQTPRMDVWDFPVDQNMLHLLHGLKDSTTNFTIVAGRMVSADRFIASNQERIDIANKFAALCCDMEASAVAQVCYLNNTRCTIIRGISDIANQQAGDDSVANVALATGNAAATLKLLIDHVQSFT